MFKTIPGNTYLEISLDGQIRTKDETACTPIVTDGKVEVHMFGTKRTVDLDWLRHVAWYEVPERFLEVTYFTELTGVLGMTKSGVMCNFTKPVYYTDGFRIVPSFHYYAVNRSGDRAIDTRTGHDVQIHSRTEEGYLTVDIYDPDRCKTREVVLHRLVAMAWVKNRAPHTRIIVNHKDSDRTNPHADNLEWCTPSENTVHAFEAGQWDCNMPCMVRDFETGDIEHYRSVTVASEAMGLSIPTNMKALCINKPHRLINDMYELKLKDDKTPWKTISVRNAKERGQYTIGIKWPDGRTQLVYNAAKLRKILGTWNISGIEALIDKAEILHPGIRIYYCDNSRRDSYQAMCLKTKEVYEADTIRKLADVTGLSFTNIQSALTANSYRPTMGYLVRFATNKPWDMDYKTDPTASWCITARCPSTEEVFTFPSVRAAATHFQVDRSVIANRLRTGKMLSGFSLKKDE